MRLHSAQLDTVILNQTFFILRSSKPLSFTLLLLLTFLVVSEDDFSATTASRCETVPLPYYSLFVLAKCTKPSQPQASGLLHPNQTYSTQQLKFVSLALQVQVRSADNEK